MSIRPCLDNAIKERAITQAAADELDLLYNRFVAQQSLVNGDAEARRLARERIAARMEATAAHQRRVALLQASAIEGRWNDLAAYRNARGEVDVASGLLELIETFGKRDHGLASGSLQGKRKAMFAQFVARFEGELDKLDRDITGRPRNRAMADNIVRELHGQGTGDAAAGRLATVFRTVAEEARQLFNEAGGAIQKLEQWALPQHHDAQALRNVGFETWAGRIDGLLDWDRMRHALSGDPILPDERADVLRHVYDTVLTDGWAHAQASTQPQGRGALYRQRSDHRFLIFKDADAHLAYARDFGQPDVLSVMMGHLELMARDIAAMKLLGPNPQATLEWLRQRVLIEAAAADRGAPALVPRESELLGLSNDSWLHLGRSATTRAKVATNRANSMWQVYSGAADAAVDSRFSAAFTTVRNTITATALGSASLSAPTDQAFGAFARNFALGSSIPGSLAHQFKIIIDGIAEHFRGGGGRREQALRAGIHFDHLANVYGQRAREANAVSGVAISRHVADQVLRKQGLVALTSTQKNGFGLELMGAFADESKKVWADIHPPVRRLLERYGLGAEDWEFLSLARLHDHTPDGQGATILRGREIREMGVDDLGRMLARDRDRSLAARQVLARFDTMLVGLSQEIRDGIGLVLRGAADGTTTSVRQMQVALAGVYPDLPRPVRQRLATWTGSREGFVRALEDLRDNSYVVNEAARARWRQMAGLEDLPPSLQRVLADPELSVGDARDILRAATERAGLGPREGPPTIPSDRAADRVRRYFTDLSERYLEMIIQETTYAVPEGTLRSRSFSSEMKKGTFVGEMMRSAAQFKGFGMSVALLWGGRVHNELASGRVGLSALPFAATALGVLTFYGMASLQLKQLAKGEDPRDMTDWRTWAAAMAQSGGAGIYGDFFMADQNRFGGSVAGTIAGPTVGRVETLLKATLGNVQQAADDKKTNAGREAAHLLQSLDPLSSLWWTKLAWDRMAHQQLRRLVDPEAAQAARRRIDTARRDRKTEFWWRPGDAAPERVPDLGSAVGRR